MQLSPRPRFARDQIVGLPVAFADVVWRLRYDREVAPGLNARIVDEPASQSKMPEVERRESPCRCPGAVQVEMLASTAGSQRGASI